jgi:hypothetical protein
MSPIFLNFDKGLLPTIFLSSLDVNDIFVFIIKDSYPSYKLFI